MTTDRLRAVATGKAETPVAKFSSFLEKLKPQIANALPRHMNAERMARLALTAFSTNADLQQCSAQSIAGSIMTAAQLGLEPDTPMGHAYLLPFNNNATNKKPATTEGETK